MMLILYLTYMTVSVNEFGEGYHFWIPLGTYAKIRLEILRNLLDIASLPSQDRDKVYVHTILSRPHYVGLQLVCCLFSL